MEHSTLVAAGTAPAEFVADPKELAKAVAYLAKRIIDPRQTMPILACIRFDADIRGKVTLTAADCDIYASVTLDADVRAPGQFCIDSAALADLLKKAGKCRDEIRITECSGEWKNRALLIFGRNRFNVPCLPADDFPTPIGGIQPPLSAFRHDAPRFLADLAALAPCMGRKERYYLNGISFERHELAGQERFVMVATDGGNMGIASRALPDGAADFDNVILPSKAVAAIIAAGKLYGEAKSIDCSIADAFRFHLGPVSIYAKAINGTFPEWQRIFENGQTAPTGAQECLFPDLLPGAPLAAMEALAKPFKQGISWSPARDTQLGSVPGDDGLFFVVMNLTDDSACGKSGFSYASEHGQGEIIGPDGVTYPVAFSDKAINLSAAQVRALCGETETLQFTIAGKVHHVALWLWEDGAGTLGTIQPNGRCFPLVRNPGNGPWWLSGGESFTRAEIEAALAGEVVEISSPEGAAMACEPIAAQEGGEAVDALREAPSEDFADMGEIAPEREWVCDPCAYDEPISPDPIAELTVRITALEARLAVMAEPAPLSVESEVTPNEAITRSKRTPAHERAIRRAWVMRKARRGQADLDARALIAAGEHCRSVEAERETLREQLANVLAAYNRSGDDWIKLRKERDDLEGQLQRSETQSSHWLHTLGQCNRRIYELERQASKRHRSTVFARDLQKRLNSEHRLVDQYAAMRREAEECARDMSRKEQVERERATRAEVALSAVNARNRELWALLDAATDPGSMARAA